MLHLYLTRLYTLINSFLTVFGYRLVRLHTLRSLEKRHDDKHVVDSLIDAVTSSFATHTQLLLRDNIRLQWRIIDSLTNTIPNYPHVCPLCTHANDPSSFPTYTSRCIFGGGILIRHQCPSCHVIFGPHKMLCLSDADIAEEYTSHYAVYAEGDTLWKELEAFYTLDPQKHLKYLNFGSGSDATAMRTLRAQGWNVWSFEPHSAQSAIHQPNLITSWTELNQHRFAGIFSNDVIEHLIDPVHILSKLAQLLDSGGLMVHGSCCFDYLYEYTRIHLYFFVDGSFRVLASKAGLAVATLEGEGEYKRLILTRQ